MESTRVVMLRNWHFDILNMEHWQIAWELWRNSWVISEPKEWAFVLIIISFIPLWFTGWIALSLVSWGKVVWHILTLPWKLFKNFFYKPVKIIATNTGVTPIKKKKSYKEIRPRALHPNAPGRNGNGPAPISIPVISPNLISPGISAPKLSHSEPRKLPAAEEPQKFEHALFKFDDDFDDIDFDIDSFDVSKSKKSNSKNRKSDRNNRSSNEYSGNNRQDNRKKDEKRNDRSRDKDPRYIRDDDDNNDIIYEKEEQKRTDTPYEPRAKSDINRENMHQRDSQKTVSVAPRQISGSCMDIIKQKGYEIITRSSIKNTTIDYIAISDDTINLCLLDREQGDWLADEERFNDEEPLWFSENSHRISPVRKIDLAKQYLIDTLEKEGVDFKVEAYVIIQIGNIINAEDMFEIWDSMNINVTRIDRGTPREIKLFARTLPDAQKIISASKLDKITKLIRNMN